MKWQRTEPSLRLDLVSDAVTAMESAESLEEALAEMVELVCTRTIWQYAETWVPSESESGEQLLRAGSVWYGDVGRHYEYRSVSTHFTFQRGEGLPGRAWQTGDVQWIRDAAWSDPSYFRRASAARDADLHAGIAAPITDGEDLVAVVTFFRHDRFGRDRESVELVGTLAKIASLVARAERFRGAAEDAGDSVGCDSEEVDVDEWSVEPASPMTPNDGEEAVDASDGDGDTNHATGMTSAVSRRRST
ncbi:GAF domain-containing protein [Haloarchaeobius sp. TZWWS8]|uniref:GAF domain-containing protein n=1 Tax=Haloarchaeobius sp. TZWWS8 TaxID=3446121 RepID=UPI003EB90B1C